MKLAGVVFGALRLGVQAVEVLPGGRGVVSAVGDVERQVIRAIREHVADVDRVRVDGELATVEVADDDSRDDSRDSRDDDGDGDDSPEYVLRQLMQRSMYDRAADSANALHLALLRALLPDEARIFAAVSDGSRYPVMHVAEPGIGPASDYLLRNASTVGRAAGVALPHNTPFYLGRMLRSGLLAIGPEDLQMRDEYEMLLTDGAVNAAITSASRGLRPARVARRTLHISPLGKQVWEAAK